MLFVNIAILLGVTASVTYGAPLSSSEIKPFIIGGVDAPVAYAPYMAALIFGERVQFQLCGASIITRRLMLTAAHCVEAVLTEDQVLIKSFQARVGSNQWNSGGTISEIKDYYIHPKWDSRNIKNDAAILLIKELLVFSKYVGTIGLAFDFVVGNEKSLVTGWGRTGPRFEDNAVHLQPTPDDMQLLYVNTIDHEQCQEQMIAVAGSRAPLIQRDVEICTFHSQGHGMCHGDSGSALVSLDSRQQIGIVSWGFDCATGAPDIYVRICGIKNFLEHILNKHKD